MWFTTSCGCLWVLGGSCGVLDGGGRSGGGDTGPSSLLGAGPGPAPKSAARSPLWAELRRERVRCSAPLGGVRGRVQPPSRRGGRGGGGDGSRGGGGSLDSVGSLGGSRGGASSGGSIKKMVPVGEEGSHEEEVDDSRFLRGGRGGGGNRGARVDRLGGGGGGGWEGGADGATGDDSAAPMRTGAKTLLSLCRDAP